VTLGKGASMRHFLLLGAALAGVLQAPADGFAFDGQAQAAIEQGAALELARLMSPRELMISIEVREFDKNFVASLSANPEMKALETQYPGLLEAMHQATRDLIGEEMGRSVEQAHASLAQLIGKEFTAADIAELTAFYRSPIGQKTLTQMAEATDASGLYQQAVQQPDFKLTENQAEAQIKQTARAATKSFTDDKQVQLMLFMAKPSFLKLAKAQPEIRKIMVETFNSKDPEFDKSIEQAMALAVQEHIARFETQPSKK
jgi:hypothetical protein